MQNQNAQSWPWNSASASTSAASAFPQGSSLFPTGFPPPSANPSSVLANYQQMYGAVAAAAVAAASATTPGATGATPGASDYDPLQWSAAQMQQWQQWQQYQEKLQEWHAQYGKKYAETMAALGQNPNVALPAMQAAANLLKPPEPAANPGYTVANASNPPLPSASQPVPPPPPDEEKPPLPGAAQTQDVGKSARQPPKENPEELSEAEKTFDIQFKQWEQQFNEWKSQNQDHPDKAQYREYEKKWEKWREQLLQRREQMRKKRLSKVLDTGSDNSNSAPAKLEETKPTLPIDSGPAQGKPSDPEYSYKSQMSTPVSHMGSYTTAPPKFDMSKPPPFGNPQGNFENQRNSDNFFNQKPPSLLSLDPGNLPDFTQPPGNFGNRGKDNQDFNRPGNFGKDNQNFNRNPGFFGNQSPNFENKDRNLGGPDGNFNQKFNNRNSGPDPGPNQQRFGSNFNRDNDFPSLFGKDNFDDNNRNDNFKNQPRFGNNNQDFGPNRFQDNEKGPNFNRPFDNCGPNRNQRGNDFNNQRFNEQNFNQGLRNFQEKNFNAEIKSLFDSANNSGGPSGGPSSLLGKAPLLNNPPLMNNPPLLNNPIQKPKVPSLFDITFDKPPALESPKNEKKPWEKYEKDDYYDDPFEEQDNRDEIQDERPWGNNNSNNSNNSNRGKFSSPWAKPWEMERNNQDRNSGSRQGPWEDNQRPNPWMEPPRQGPWEEGPNNARSPWGIDQPSKTDIEKAELSGYVGNILAKLGNINADTMPGNITGENEGFNQGRQNFPNRGGENDGNRNNLRGNNFGRGGNNRNQRNFGKQQKFNENEKFQNSPREIFQDSPRDNFNNEPNRGNFRNQNRMSNKGPGKFDRNDQPGPERQPEAPPNRNLNPDRKTDFTDDVDINDGNFHTQNSDGFSQDKLDESELFNSAGDTDDRNVPEKLNDEDDRIPFGQNDRNFRDLDDRGPFIREDSRGSFGRDDDRSFGRDDDNRIPFRDERDDRHLPGRDDRNFRGGRGRKGGRGGFDRDDRDDRLRGNYDRGFDDRRGPMNPYDRWARVRDLPPEPEWNPQVFDYSQPRSQRFADLEETFKFSKVVDYSHGAIENMQTFDYGHGGKVSDKKEVKAFDYGHGGEAPEVIDYGHGGDDKEKNTVPDWKKEKEKELKAIMEKETPSKLPEPERKRSPSPVKRSRSRSPLTQQKEAQPPASLPQEPPPPSISFQREPSTSSFQQDSQRNKRSRSRSPAPPLFRGRRSRSRDRFGRPIPKRNPRREEATEVRPQTTDNKNSKNSFDVTTVLVEDLICLPGRNTRPNKLVFIMRGLPGSGKTYVTKLIKDKEVEMGGDAPRILSLDDYFMTEVEKEETDPETGRKVKNKVLEYEYESGAEPHYRGSLLKAFKKTISDGFFSFIIVDSINEKTKDYEEMWSFAKQKGFQVYVAEMDDDVSACTKRNVHKRTEKEIQDLAIAWEKTPSHYIRLDVRSLLQAAAITEVEMEVVSDTEMEKSDGEEQKKEGEKKEDEEEDEPGVETFVKSRWDTFENSEQKLDRLDGLKRRREGCHTTMEDYLQLPDDFDQQFDPTTGKKRVRWADLEERRQQEKMRAIGFVVGQTDWQRMTDPTFGESALTRTKYI